MYGILSHSLFALLTAFAVSAAACPVIIPVLRFLHTGKKTPEGPDGVRTIPLMGGIVILAAMAISTLLWGRDSYSFVLIALLLCCAFAMVGFLDDFLRITHKREEGFRPWQRVLAESVISLAFAYWMYRADPAGPVLWLGKMNLGILYVPFAALVILTCVSSMRVTDAFGGLASTVTGGYSLFLSAMLCISVITAAAGADAELLEDRSALSAFAMSVCGGSLGFLLYNTPPAKVKLGSTGSMLLGGAASAMALMSHTVPLLPLMGLCFLTPAATAAMRRVFKGRFGGDEEASDVPLLSQMHEKGMPESKTVTVLGIITVICGAAALLLYWFLK